MIVEITGGTAEFRDRPNVRQRKIIRAASADMMEVLRRKYNGDLAKIRDADSSEIRNDGELMNALDDFGCQSLVTLLVSWTLDIPMPRTVPEWWDFEDADLYDELVRAVTPLGYAAIGSGAVAVSPEAAQDPDSPTGLSSDSSEGEQAPTTSSMIPLAG